jgi:hypothetical protein
MSKYYRVIKDLPAWEVGCIVEKRDNKHYYPISDLWNKKLDNGEEVGEWWEGNSLVEGSSEFFERVYSVKGLGKTKYLTKKAAKALHEKEYKEV